MAYRGYSDSEGEPTEEGIQLDSIAIMDFVTQRTDTIDPDNILVFGRSLGGAVATYALATGGYKVRGTAS